MTKALFTIIIQGILLLLSTNMHAAGQDELYNQYSRLSSDALLAMGHRFSQNDSKSQESIICYSIVASRYSDSMSDREKRKCMDAILGEWMVYFYDYYDVSKLFDLLQRARDIGDDIRYSSPALWLNYGIMYQTIYDQTGFGNYGQQALECYNRAYRLALKDKSVTGTVTDMIVSNTILVSYLTKRLNDAENMLESYRRRTFEGQDAVIRKFNIDTYKSVKLLSDKRYNEAIRHLSAITAYIPDMEKYIRYRYIAFCNLASAFAEKGDYKEAVRRMSVPEDIAMTSDMKDMKVEVYDIMGDYYGKLGDRDKALQYKVRKYELKDSILNFEQAAKVSESKFVNRISKLEALQEKAALEKKIQTAVVTACICIVVIVLVCCYIIYNRNKRLRQRNQSLYEQNLKILAQEEERHRHTPDINGQTAGAAVTAEDNRQGGFKPSDLDMAYINKVGRQIIEVMENTDAPYKADFSVQTLSDMINVKYKTVSEVIHEKFDCNFNTFINKYRVREACKRINNPDYALYTIEGIMQSVGFKSRSSFISSFKRETGLKPSEYQKIAKEKAAASSRSYPS